VLSNSPTFTGTPVLPAGTIATTQTVGNNSTAIATTAYVDIATDAINTLANGKIYLGDTNGAAQEVTLTGDVTIDNAGVTTIGASKVVTGMIAEANVTTTKIADANITNAKLDKTNIPLSGFGAAGADVALGANKLTGVANPANDQDAATKKYVDDAATAINTLADGTIYLGDTTNQAAEVTITGDVTMSNVGVSTIGTSKVVTGMIADGTILVGDLANDAVETAKIKDANVTTAKIADANITDAKLDKTNIPLSGFGAASADVALGANKLTGVANPANDQDAATKKYVDDAATAINTLADGTIYLGDENGDAQEVTLSGDVTINNAGVSTIGASKVVTGMIADGTILVGDLANDAVETAKIKNANVTTAKIADANITTAKILDANVTNAKLDKTNIPLSGFGAASADVALGANKLTGVADPTLSQDAATKSYVDTNTGNNSSKIGAIIAATGLNSNGSYAPTTGANYISSASSVAQADSFLDTQIKLNTYGIATISTASNNLITEVNAIEAATGLNADGTYATISGTNYLSSASSVAQADTYLDAAIKANSDAISLKATIASPTFTGTVGGITKSMVGLGSVDNTADVNKPVSTAAQTALALKENAANKSTDVATDGASDVKFPTVKSVKTYVDTNTGNNSSKIGAIIAATGLNSNGSYAPTTGANYISSASSVAQADSFLDTQIKLNTDGIATISTASNNLITEVNAIEAATGLNADGTYATISGTNYIGSASSVAQADTYLDAAIKANSDALLLKVPIASPTFTGTVGGITKSMVGLGNVDNTSDANKAVSTATQTALDLKANLASPTLTGAPLAPTATAGTNTTQIATTAYVTDAVNTATTGSFVDVTTNQTIAGNKTFTGNLKVGTYMTLGKGGGNNTYNTAFGESALVQNTTGKLNTAIGFDTQKSVTTGEENTAVGAYTLLKNTASYNTALGNRGLQLNTSGNQNVAVGFSVLNNTTTGNYNVGLGASAGSFILDGSTANTTGDYNVFLGANTKAKADNDQNEIVIGYAAVGNGSNTIQLGNNEITTTRTSGTITAGAVTYTNTDGSNGQVLTTNGSGITSWGSPAPGVRDVADEVSATASQTSFTLTQTPSTNSKVKMYVNGIRISNTAYSISGSTLTYVPANNGGYALTVSDRIQFDYFY
jgi:hypothetical protein